MKTRNKFLATLTGLTLAFGAVSTASAATVWQHHHPRRAEVNARLHRQDLRIDHERRDGQIDRIQARDLHAEDHGIRAEERFDAGKDHSHITRREDLRLNHQENAVSGQIGR